MWSTLSHLARELGTKCEVTMRQRRVFVDSLELVERSCSDAAVVVTARRAQERVVDAPAGDSAS